MRSLPIIFSMIIMTFSTAAAFDGDCGSNGIVKVHRIHSDKVITYHDGCCMGNYRLDIDGDEVYLDPTNRGYKSVRITADHRLFVDHKEIDLSSDQKELVGEFHDLAVGLYDEAKAIGCEGALIGAEGAKLGVEALASVVKLLRSDYDSDDLEREMEAKAAKIEAKAAKLEEKADKLEEKADRLKEIEGKMEREIPEFRNSRES